MNMKKIVTIFSMALAACALTTSCTKLESEMYDTINPGIFPTTEDDANALVTAAAYGPFRAAWYDGLFTSAQGGIQVVSDMTTDIGSCQWDDPVWPDMLQVNFTPHSTEIATLYSDQINNISKMTLTLDRIANISMDEEVKARLQAELHLGRGWLAYILYDMYGPIQIASSELLNNPLAEEVAPRLTQEEMVKYIEDEINAALPALPAKYQIGDTGYGRFTRALGYMVLMKLYMHEKNWPKAIECGRELQKPEYGFDLMESYKDIFTLQNEGNKETIWATVCDRSENAQMWLAHVLSSPYPTTNVNIQKWGGYRVLWDFYHTFEAGDKRLEVLVGEFDGTDGFHYSEETPGTVLIDGALPIKYGEDPDATGEESSIDWIVYRYADVLTLLSEALVRDGNAVTQEAVDLLNEVRDRAGLPLKNVSDFASVQEFLDFNLLERGHELWFEGCRRSDLIRYGYYIEYARKYKNSAAAQDYMNVFPLPQSVIDESKGQIAQNPGY